MRLPVRAMVGALVIALSVPQFLSASRLDQQVAAPKGHVENVSFEIVGGSVIITYDLVSDTPNAVYSVVLKASDDGGKTFAITPKSVTGALENVKPGTKKVITWVAANDGPVLSMDQLKFDVVPTAGPMGQGTAPVEKGGNKLLTLWLPIAGAGAVGAFFAAKALTKEPCAFSVSSSVVSIPPVGGSASISVIAAPADCSDSWTTTSADFVTVSPTSGNGNGSVSIVAGANPGATRSTTVTVAGRSVQVTQSAGVCTFSVSSDFFFMNTSAGTNLVTVITSPDGCSPNTWTASITSNPSSFISGLTPTTGTGNQALSFAVAANSGAAREGTITVIPANGAAIPITVFQPLGGPGTYCILQATKLSPSNNTIVAAGGQVDLRLTVPGLNCQWHASFEPNPGNFLKFLNMSTNNGVTASGFGTQTLMISVAGNSGAPRNGTVIITFSSFSSSAPPVAGGALLATFNIPQAGAGAASVQFSKKQ